MTTEPRRIWESRFYLLARGVESEGIRVVDLRVLTYLLDLFNTKRGCAWPKVATICKDLGLGERQVMRAVQRLGEFGLIETEKVGPGAYEYVPLFEEEVRLPKDF
jgi:predicted transcriptional regulator